jgi:hypothetical protein
VTLSAVDLTAATSTHTHGYVQTLNTLTGAVSIVAGSNVTITTSGTTISVAASAGGGSVSSVNTKTGAVTLSFGDVSAASTTSVALKVSSDTTSVSGANQIVNMMRLTTAQYSAITSPDTATLYVIVG